MRLALVLALVLAGAAQAQDLPALFDVRGVASDDVLNVRAEPSGSARIVGSLPPDAQGVEVVERQGNWGRVNVGDGTGWTSLRYLEIRAGSGLPQASEFACFGTEPFWSLDVAQDSSADLSLFGGTPERFAIGRLQPAAGYFEPFALTGSGATGALTVVLAPEYCSDGMSDMAFGIATTVVVGGPQTRIFAGCCSLAR